MARERITLDLPDLSAFKPRQNAPAAVNPDDVREAAEAAGFKTRHGSAFSTQKLEPASVPFDARSLRRTGRTAKLNIATRETTRERFWQLAQQMELTVGEDVLIVLMDNYERVRGGEDKQG